MSQNSCIKLTHVTEVIGSIMFNEKDFMKLLSNKLDIEISSIIECVCMFYIDHMYGLMTKEEIEKILQFITAVLSNYTYSQLAENNKSNFKSIFSTLLVGNGSSEISDDNQSNPLNLFHHKVLLQ